MGFFRSISPRRAVRDFVSVWRMPVPHRSWFLAGSAAMTLTIFLTFFGESGFRAPLPEPEVIFFENWSLDRTDEEIVADLQARYLAQLEEEKRLADLAERRRERYKTVGRVFGMDVEAVERRAELEAYEEARAEQDPAP